MGSVEPSKMPQQPARFGASHGVTRPKSYDTNYDKWDRIDDSDSDDEPSKKSKSKSAKSKPGEINSIEDLDENDRRLLQAAQMAQRGQMSGDKAMIKDSMNMAESAMRAKGVPDEEVNKVMAGERAKFGLGPAAPIPGPEAKGPLDIHTAKGKMKSALSAHEKELERLHEQEEMLSHLTTPEDFFKFMEQSGLSEEQIQRCMSGDPTAMEEAIRSHENNLDDHQTQATLSQVDELTNQIKEMSASRDSVLKEQNAAVDNLKQKQEMHQAQLAELRKMETQKDDIQEKMKKAEELMAQACEEKADEPEDPEEAQPSSSVPKHTVENSADGKEVTVTVELPGISSVGDVDLDVDNDEGGLSLEAGEFELKVKLPDVDEEKVKAKFVKESCTLIVILQIL